ncbi:hypothetical protein Tco_0453723 [Tanacetum coccineum]
MQTQEDHSHQTQAVNSDSLKVDLVVKQNSCSEKEDSNSETASNKSAKECSLNSEPQDSMTDTYFVESLEIKVQTLQNTSEIHYSNTWMQMQESKIDTGKALDNGLVVIESNGTESEVQDDSSRSGNDTDANDANIRPIYDEDLIAEYPETCQVKSHMLDLSPDNQTTEYSKQSLESENILLKKTVA